MACDLSRFLYNFQLSISLTVGTMLVDHMHENQKRAKVKVDIQFVKDNEKFMVAFRYSIQ